MNLCPQCDPENPDVCDFCKYYRFNANKKGQYTGNGFCIFLNEKKEPFDGCDNFYCALIDTAIPPPDGTGKR